MLPPSKDGWGNRIYSVVLERGEGVAGSALCDGWVGTFPGELNKGAVRDAVIAYIARQGYGAPEVKI